MAHALRNAGLKPGDRVAILLSNCFEYFELYFGAARAGIIAVPVNYRLTPGKIAEGADIEKVAKSLTVFDKDVLSIEEAPRPASSCVRTRPAHLRHTDHCSTGKDVIRNRAAP